MRSRIKFLFLCALKYVGAFHVSRLLTRRELRVLCYHGVSIADEHLFRRTLFMRPETFRRRMEYLARSTYEVLKLDDAVEQLKSDSLPPWSVVITIDDGWYGCLAGMFPALRELGLDATLYLTTYYARQREPVFDVIVGYLFWKTDAHRVTLEGFGELDAEMDLSTSAARELASESIVEYGNSRLDLTERARLVTELARLLNVDYSSIERDRRFRLIPLEDVGGLSESGVDVQLHTHRHRFDLENREQVRKEIIENREHLEPRLGKKLEHFCYPSGVYHPRVYPWLEELGIKSATTALPGMCGSSSFPLELPRIIDGEDVDQIEFEAELAGALELLRRARAVFRRAG